MAATEDKLGAVHTALAEWATLRIKGETGVIDNETGEEIRAPLSAAEAGVIRAFLNDNKITCAPSGDNALGKLEAALREKQQARLRRNQPVMLPDLDDMLSSGPRQ
jgi:hypothetical protein